MIVDAAILILFAVLFVGGCWLLWNATAEAWADWRRGQ